MFNPYVVYQNVTSHWFDPPLKQIHREKKLEWEKILKQNFVFVLFTDECQATLNRVMELMDWEEDGVIQRGYIHSISGVNKEVAMLCFGPRSMSSNFNNVNSLLYSTFCDQTLFNSNPVIKRIGRQQGDGDSMFWTAIINDQLVGSFQVKGGITMTAPTYIAFLKQDLIICCHGIRGKVLSGNC